MNWQEVCNNPFLKDLPFKIELNEWDKIVMSPASNKHGFFQMKIGILLSRYIQSGEIISECSVETDKGVKVADAAWISDDFLKNHGYETPYKKAPEICIEILSPSNLNKEMNHKMKLYFDKGAKEVWFCNDDGEIWFNDPDGLIACSRIAPSFPGNLNLKISICSKIS
ncbi:Putative restriction endonuclease, DUF820 [Desulfonema limicola]|uniref:Restriction endonuclease, DUF820 n=1 Tax=Desulfonema limicola TaxID=45656 RepID=A0A975B963_9BACT|nr:Uma2 family endonuclease [Desulfonema limicola]QTA80885.1 Putative restriction endonuclease, DUF820 [Desulfonema limicola]